MGSAAQEQKEEGRGLNVAKGAEGALLRGRRSRNAVWLGPPDRGRCWR